MVLVSLFWLFIPVEVVQRDTTTHTVDLYVNKLGVGFGNCNPRKKMHTETGRILVHVFRFFARNFKARN